MDKLGKIVEKLEGIADRLETASVREKSSKSISEVSIPCGTSKSLNMQTLKVVIDGCLKTFVDLSATIDDDVKIQANLLLEAFQAECKLLSEVSKMSKPAEAQIANIFGPCSAAIQKVVQFKDSKRSSAFFNHLAAVSESAGALGWIGVLSKPDQFINEMRDAGKFYSNRVLKEFRDKDPKQVNWVQALDTVWGQLVSFVMNTHPAHLNWGSSGASVGSPPMGCPPPPPPPPPPAPDASNAGESREALFAQLNRGDAVTSGLRKVTDDMKVHKNPQLKATSGVAPKAGPPAIPLRPDQRKAQSPQKVPPCLELRGNKWCVENYTGNNEVIVDVKQLKETVYIYKCVNSVVNVKGKTNSIVLDNCKKTALLFENVISSVDVVNCQSVQLQVTGLMPTVNIDKTDGCQIYLSEESKNAEIITAKSSEMNILIPKGDGDYAEYPIPEQFKTKFTGSKLTTTVNDLT